MRTRVYVDGYNLYYGCLKGSAFKWLDLLSLFDKCILPSVTASINGLPLASELQAVAIKFFTAPILEKASKAQDSIKCQDRYHAALNKHQQGRVETIKGYYSLTEARARLIDQNDPKKWPRDCTEVPVWKLEEKQSDVNLAIHAVADALRGDIEQVVIVSNDTDLAPALKMIRDYTGVVIGLVIPTTDHQRIPNTALAELAHWVRTHITEDELRVSQLPRVIQDKKRPVAKPESWYAHPELLARALELGQTQLGSKSKVFQWLNKPNQYYQGQMPLDLLEAGDEKVLQFMAQWASSGPDAGI
ncbi:MAG: NYN domain-containing protein [Pseudomonadota bacterium]